METLNYITLFFSIIALVVSGVALYRNFKTQSSFETKCKSMETKVERHEQILRKSRP